MKPFICRIGFAVLNPFLCILNALKCRDLQDPWEDSALKIALLTDSEVSNLTMEYIDGLTDRQFDLLKIRINSIKSEPFSGAITEDNFKNLKLIHLRSLPKDILNELVEGFSEKILSLLTPEQLDHLEISNLYNWQFKYVYEDTPRIQKLQLPKLAECIPRLHTLLPFKLTELTYQQIISLDFSYKGPIHKTDTDNDGKSEWLPSIC